MHRITTIALVHVVQSSDVIISVGQVPKQTTTMRVSEEGLSLSLFGNKWIYKAP